LDAAEILNKGLVATITEVGRLFEEGEYFVPEMLITARAMQAGVAILKPKLLEADIKPPGKVVIQERSRVSIVRMALLNL